MSDTYKSMRRKGIITHLIKCICKNCEKEFITRKDIVNRGNGIFCNKSCAWKYWHLKHPRDNRILLYCLNCGKEFKRSKSEIKFGRYKYCSKFCKDFSQLGKLRNEETKMKMKNNRKPYIVTLETRDKMSKAAKGKIVSSITRKKIGDAHRGEKSQFWKGGITPLKRMIIDSSDYRNWIRSILIRDNFICQECGKRGYKLDVHHIKPFAIIFQEFLKTFSYLSPIEDKENLLKLSYDYTQFWDKNNCITLCRKCHLKTENFAKRYDLIKI